MINLILKILDKLDRKIIINNRDHNKSPYLVRYIILRTKLLSVYLHRFMSSDLATPHDHPWASLSFMLKGKIKETIWDIEKQEEKKRLIKKGQIVYRKINHCHRIEVFNRYNLNNINNAPLTLFITGPRVKPWGFVNKDKWTLWTSYLGLSDKEIKEIYKTDASNV